MPYGAVMATGAASQLAPAAGLPVLAAPLVGWTIAQALLIAVAHLVRHPRTGGGEPAPPAARRFGTFTIPIGAAVIGTNLAAEAPSRAALAGALLAVILGWLTTGWLLARVIAPVAFRPPGSAAVEGTWFLAPAALLADAIGTAATLPGLSTAQAAQTALAWLALAVCAAGVLSYALFVALAAARVGTHGLSGAGRAPWWISAGCASLAAAAVGRVATVAPIMPNVAGVHGFAWTALALWAIGSMLLIPVIAASLRHLCRLQRPWGPAAWPPTFSTGVYALGTEQASTLNHLPAIQTVGHLAGITTLALWATTTLVMLTRAGHTTLDHARHQPRP
jgi:tellurite resistance protein TehA-like permease